MARMSPSSRWSSWRPAAVVFLAVVVAMVGEGKAEEGEEGLVTRIAFGSCSNQSAPQPIWDAIIDFDPQVFIWLGDNIYGDIRRPFRLFGKERTIGPWKNVPRFVPSSQQQMEYRYRQAKSNPGYSRLHENAKVIGTWDDHDFGLNDAGKEFSRKVTNQQLMLDFLDEPMDSPRLMPLNFRRKQGGVYASYTFGPFGRQVKVILFDTRYHRDPLSSDGSMLGTAQWAWLEKEMKGPATEITIIGSSIQVMSNLSAVTGPLFTSESWGRFPTERERLFKLIHESKRNGVLFLSGDVHFGEISRYDCGVSYPLYDITSSGLTQAVEKAIPWPLHFAVRFLAWFTPNTMRVMGHGCRYRSCTYGQPNFGAIQIHWNENPVNLKIEVRDTNGHPATSVNVSLSDLTTQSATPGAAAHLEGYHRHCSLEVTLPWIIRFRLAILVFSALIASSIVLLVLVGLAISHCAKCISKNKLD